MAERGTGGDKGKRRTMEEGKLINSGRCAPPKGWTQKEWDIYVDGMIEQSRLDEEAAIENGTYHNKMHYGSHPWAATTHHWSAG